MKSKKIIIFTIFVIVLIFVTIFLILHYKNGKGGNTMINKSEGEIVEYILNIKSYEAKLNITVETNKNKTEYVVSQKLQNNLAQQEVIQPTNIAGVITEYDGSNLKIKNNKLDLETTFQNYQYIVKNKLWLDSFIEDYKMKENPTTVSSNDNEIILEVKTNENTYNVYKKLYVDKKTAKPIKMIVQDINKKILVYILYTEITIS